jgi:hypothetical protein
VAYDLWTEASADVEAEHAAGRLTRAKVAVAPLWPFLSMARSASEFEHRLALTAERIGEEAGVDLFDAVIASLREDFQIIAKDEDESEEDDADDKDSDGKPEWLQKKIDKSSSLEFFHAGLGRWVAVDDDATAGKGNPYYFTGGPEGGPNTGQTNQFPASPTQDPWSPINDMFPMQPTPWEGGVEWQENPMNFTPPGGPAQQKSAAAVGENWCDGSASGRHTATYHQGGVCANCGWKKGGIDTSNAAEYGAHQHGTDTMIERMNNSRSGSRLPFSAAQVGARDTCADCRGPVKAVRVGYGTGVEWTHTGEHGMAADDHHVPVPESVMRTAVQHAAGEQNPHYFDSGHEGVEGDDDDQFPADVASGVDPTDERVDWYQNPIQPLSKRAVTETQENPGPDSDKLLGTEFASPQERERWRKAQDGEFPGSRDMHAMGSRHTFYDPFDVGVRVLALGGGADGGAAGGVRSGAEGGNTNDFVTQLQQMQQGLSPQMPGNPADASNAMANQMSTPDKKMPMAAALRYLGLDGGGGPSEDGGGVPPIPPSMTQGGPGSIAQKPLTTGPRQIPSGGGGGAPGDAMGAGEDPSQSATASRRTALGDSRDLPSAEDPTGLGDEYRERTINGPLSTRPRQSAEHRNVNTPQRPQEPIPTHSSSGAEEEEDEDERKEASRIARRAIRELVGV